MSNKILIYIMGITAGLFVAVIIAYIIIKNKASKSDALKIKQLKEGTKEQSFSLEILFQKLYVKYKSIPVIKRYLLKIRRKIEIINIDDEYKTRKQSAKIITETLIAVLIITIVIIIFTKGDPLLLTILLLFEAFLVETITTGMVDKLDDKVLKQQIGFFAEIRHAYHEVNMVEEAIYEVSQNDELEVSRQGEKIYEILTSDDPETELEKYYDVAPNSFLKEFAGISYLTKEFGDRSIDGASLYLKNLNNITEEMQLEILKRDKLNYVFQSLSIISLLPVLAMQPLKNWAISSFSFTAQFYNGKLGLIIQIALIVLTFLCFILTRKLKDSGNIKDEYKDQNKVWQMKIYKNKIAKKIMDLIIPKKNTKDYRVVVKLLKEAASKQKMEALYVNKLVICLTAFIISILFFGLTHKVAVNYIYTEPTAEYDIIGGLNEDDQQEAMEVTEQDNKLLDKLKGNSKITQEKVTEYISNSPDYKDKSEEEIEEIGERVYKKLKIINKENFKWFELLLSFVFAWVGYSSPTWILFFQKILRSLEMENEVMQFQTIIMMLMKIERVNVEMILEWLERYANIFKEPITRCVNNYEAGAWEALEKLKEEIAFPQLIRIVESLQAAVEKIPICEAFDELDNEREYYKAKREESNERLIKRKGLIGKIIGFAPMVCLFVGYLIVPLVAIGLTSMTESFSTMSTMS